MLTGGGIILRHHSMRRFCITNMVGTYLPLGKCHFNLKAFYSQEDRSVLIKTFVLATFPKVELNMRNFGKAAWLSITLLAELSFM